MIAISFTVIVCAVTAAAAADGTQAARSCEVYNEARPMSDLGHCLHEDQRYQLALDVLKRAGRTLAPKESVDTSCRMMTGGGSPTG
jgi:hypothetical protein